jgi:hypothetical protein
MTEQQQVLRGQEAAQLLDNEAFKLAMQSLKTSVLEQWKACPIRDQEGQTLLLQLAKLTDKFESLLIGMIESGKFAQRQIELDKLRNEPKARQFVRKVLG